MAFFLKTWLRRHKLKKFSSTGKTGFVPLKEIRSVLLVLDGADPECRRYESMANEFFGKRGCRVSPVFIDLRRRRKDTPVYVEGENVISARLVNWFGLPVLKKTGRLFMNETDLLINLRESADFTGDFISKSSRAGFKIGICDYPGNAFDLVITHRQEPEASDSAEEHAGRHTAEIMDTIFNFLKQIVR